MQDRTVTKIKAVPRPVSFGAVVQSARRVAAYARVSTDHEEQQTSLTAQIDYYQKLIAEHPDWSFVQVYADEGISGLSTNKREAFNQMITDCEAGHIDLILTKSISRFARNTVDTITTIRELKAKGIGVYFEKEAIFTLDSKSEFVLTLMSSLAQEESRSISENTKWGQRKRFADGKSSLAYSRFLGYDKGDKKYEMVVNEEQAAVVRRIFFLFIQGYTPNKIAQILTDEGCETGTGTTSWYSTTVRAELMNEKYKGDALLQKSFTVDFLTKKTRLNKGELPQYYIENDHEAIIAPWLFDYVQELFSKRKQSDSRYSGMTRLSSKIVCGKCGAAFGPKPWHSTTYNDIVWQCRNRYKKGVRCKTHNLYEDLLHYLIHDTARLLSIKRGVIHTVLEIVQSICGKSRAEELHQWELAFAEESAWELLSDEEDIVLTIQEIIVTPDGSLEITLIDGKTEVCPIPKYSPRKGMSIMTETQKEKIRDRRIKGAGYGTIAKELGLSLDTVKSHCRRNGMAAKDKESMARLAESGIGYCRNCGAEVPQNSKRKPKVFCCDTCRQKWWNAHPDQVNRKAIYKIKCLNCGKEFEAYGNKHRKYCCHKCYIQHRFGAEA